MARTGNPFGVADRILKQASDQIQLAFKNLLENKHLYQKAKVDLTPVAEAFRAYMPIRAVEGNCPSPMEQKDLNRCHHRAEELLSLPWYAQVVEHLGIPRPNDDPDPFSGQVPFRLDGVLAVCGICKQAFPLNLIRCIDVLSLHWDDSYIQPETDYCQAFAVVCQCQACRSNPEVFLVRRDGLKLSLSGRSPIECVQVPHSIPKIVSKFYSDALVAANSGQHLAALFLTRVMIEQFMRTKVTPGLVSADEVIEEYMKTLPDDFNSRFPSFRDIYGKLSEALHGAKGDSNLFGSALPEIEKHFDARRLFSLDG